MLRIYTIPPSLYCAKLRILLRHKRLDWQEMPPPGGYGSAEYRKIVPAGNLPALIDGDLLLADSEAIAEYLNETRPEPPMLPGDPGERALVRERSRYHDTRLEPAVRALFPYIGRAARSGLDKARHEEVLADRLDGFARLLAKAPPREKMLTLGDCGFPITLLWLDVLSPLFSLTFAVPDAVRDYRAGLAEFPAVASELASYEPVLRGWIPRWEAE